MDQREYKIGDRFRWPGDGEIIESIESNRWVVIVEGDPQPVGRPPGTITRINLAPQWQYLGNFSKTDNFHQLYDLFNS